MRISYPRKRIQIQSLVGEVTSQSRRVSCVYTNPLDTGWTGLLHRQRMPSYLHHDSPCIPSQLCPTIFTEYRHSGGECRFFIPLFVTCFQDMDWPRVWYLQNLCHSSIRRVAAGIEHSFTHAPYLHLISMNHIICSEWSVALHIVRALYCCLGCGIPTQNAILNIVGLGVGGQCNHRRKKSWSPTCCTPLLSHPAWGKGCRHGPPHPRRWLTSCASNNPSDQSSEEKNENVPIPMPSSAEPDEYTSECLPPTCCKHKRLPFKFHIHCCPPYQSVLRRPSRSLTRKIQVQ